MTDPNRTTPAPDGDPAPGGPDGRPATDEAASAHDPIAERDTAAPSGAGRSGADPDGLDQSVGRGDDGQGDARTRDSAI